MTPQDIAEQLDDDGATVDLPDGRTVRFRVEADPDTSIRDFDGDGTFSQYSYDYSDDAGKVRPAGMDGNAEKIQIDRGAFVWWQPPADIKRSDLSFDVL